MKGSKNKMKFKVGDIVYTRKHIDMRVGGSLPTGSSLKVVEITEDGKVRCERNTYVNGLLTPITYCLSTGDVKRNV